MQGNSRAFLSRARSILGDAAVTERQLPEFECTTGVRRSILGTVYATDTSQVISLVRLAAAHRVPIYPVSAGHNWGYGTSTPVVDGCILLNLSRMNKITSMADRASGIVTIESGVTQGQLAEFLDREALPFLVPTTGAGPSGSIVGNALERGYGITPLADHFGAVLGFEAVLSDGSLYASPLDRVAGTAGPAFFKWGIGPYVDGLFAQGAFGVVTKMTVALARRPQALKAFLFNVGDDAALEEVVASVQSMLANLGSVVGGINVMNARRVLAMAAPYPVQALKGAKVLPSALLRDMSARYGIKAWTVFGTLYGTSRMVAAAQRDIRKLAPRSASRAMFLDWKTVDRLSRLAQKLPLLRRRIGVRLATLSSGLALVSGRPNETALPLAYWKQGGRPVGKALDPARDGCGLIWYSPLVPMEANAVRRFVTMVNEIMPSAGFEPLITMSSISERCFGSTVPVLFNRGDPRESEEARSCHTQLLEEGCRRGFVPYRLDVDSMPWLMSKAPEHWHIVAKLKRSLDPDGIIAPGRYAPVS